MKETGTVVSVEGKTAIVALGSREGCSTCGLHGVCTVTGGGKRELSLDTGGHRIKAGDCVEIETPARSLLTAAFLVFILPLVVASAAYMLISSQTGRNGPALAGFFGGFIVTEGLVALIDRLARKRSFFKPRISRKLDPSSTP